MSILEESMLYILAYNINDTLYIRAKCFLYFPLQFSIKQNDLNLYIILSLTIKQTLNSINYGGLTQHGAVLCWKCSYLKLQTKMVFQKTFGSTCSIHLTTISYPNNLHTITFDTIMENKLQEQSESHILKLQGSPSISLRLGFVHN